MHMKLGKVLSFELMFLLTLSITGSFQGIAVYACICYGCLYMHIFVPQMNQWCTCVCLPFNTHNSELGILREKPFLNLKSSLFLDMVI